MEPNDKSMLIEAFELIKENNKMLKKVRGVQKRQAVWQTIKVLIIVGIGFGAFYFLEPYINKIVDLYSSISGVEQKMNNIPIQDLLKKI